MLIKCKTLIKGKNKGYKQCFQFGSYFCTTNLNILSTHYFQYKKGKKMNKNHMFEKKMNRPKVQQLTFYFQ
jgi:hypothetical protein